ncbi:MAG: hypothetical protein JXB25_10840 [Deltaproteobacteria bacterium]|nr:hypothetical protein [Deltaproteobacteria bacterium]
MPDNLKTAKSALAKLHQDMDAINRLAKPPYLSVIEQMERTLEPIRRQQLERGQGGQACIIESCKKCLKSFGNSWLP